MRKTYLSVSRAWLTVALLFPVALLNYLDRQIFSTMKLSMMADMPSIGTDEKFGILMGVFLIVYGLLVRSGAILRTASIADGW